MTELGDITVHNLKQLKKLNQIVFPVSYNDKFYKDVLEVGPLAKLGIFYLLSCFYYDVSLFISNSFLISLLFVCRLEAYFNDIVVGAVCCRIDLSESKRRLYIMTLGCLAPYRKLGIGSVLLKHVLDYCEKDGNFESVYL